jgi:hypothetical protein
MSGEGITGTSNDTGQSSAYERLGMHLKKRGRTHSAVWDILHPGPHQLSELWLDFIFVAVPAALDAPLIEAALVTLLVTELKHRLVLNRSLHKKGKAHHLHPSGESQFARKVWAKIRKILPSDWLLST